MKGGFKGFILLYDQTFSSAKIKPDMRNLQVRHYSSISRFASICVATVTLSLNSCQHELDKNSQKQPVLEQERTIVTASLVEETEVPLEQSTTEGTALPGVSGNNGQAARPSDTGVSRSRFSPRPVEESTNESKLSVAYQRLVVGEFFHTIPSELQVNQPTLIEAGVAEKVTQDLLEMFDIDGPVSLAEGAKYDPLSVELHLKGSNPEAFSIKEISAGEKTVIKDHPDIWLWSVTPLEVGEETLSLEVVISLENNSASLQQQNLLLAQKKVSVSMDFVDLVQFYFRKNWRIGLTLISITIFGLVGSVTGYYHYRHKFSGIDPETEQSKG